MMVAAWPAISRYPQVGSYSEAPDDNVASFKPEVGPPKSRRRMSVATVVLSMEIQLSMTDYATFETFFRDTLKDGTLPFTFTHPRTLVTTTFCFVGPPTMDLLNFQICSVHFKMQTQPS